MELPGKKYDQHLDRSILVAMMVLKKKVNAKTRDLTSKSLVFGCNPDDVNMVKYIALCIDVAEREYKKLSYQSDL